MSPEKGIPKDKVMALYLAYERKDISLRQIARDHKISPAAVSQRFKRIREGTPASAQEVQELRDEVAQIQQFIADMQLVERHVPVAQLGPARNLKELLGRRRA